MVMFWMRCLMSGPMVDGSSCEGSFFFGLGFLDFLEEGLFLLCELF